MEVATAYQGRSALVTGSTGFKGTWLCAWLEQLGAQVTGLALSPTANMRSGWPGIEQRFPWHCVDIRELQAVQDAAAKTQPEIIFHMAAQPLVRESYRTPVETLAANVMGTAHVLEAARRLDSVRAVVVISSDKCYANREWQWGYRESEAMGGDDPYSASKGCTELVTACYRNSFSSSSSNDCATPWLVASGRAGNVIGGGDWAADRLIPDIIRSAIDNQPIELRYPQAVRPWQHVLEPLSGYLLLGAQLLNQQASAAQGWNFGPHTDRSMTVREIADAVVRVLGSGSVVERPPAVQLKEATLLKLDSSLSHNLLGWRALLSDQQRIQWTADWYRAWQADANSVWDKTQTQITAYQDRIRQHDTMSAAWYGTASVLDVSHSSQSVSSADSPSMAPRAA